MSVAGRRNISTCFPGWPENDEFERQGRNMRVLVTGSAGFIGSRLIQKLLDDRIDVLGIDIAEPKYDGHRGCWALADILDREGMEKIVRPFSPTHVVHLAARTDLGLDDTIEGFSANTVGVRNVVDLCVELPECQRAVFASTIIVCKPGHMPKSDTEFCPTTPYGESKVIGEQILRKNAERMKFSWCIVRPTSIWGPGYGSHYLDFFRVIAKRRYFHPGKLDNAVVYGYLGNCVHQIEKLLKADSDQMDRRVFYLGDYWSTRLLEWAEAIHRELGYGRPKVVPEALARLAARCGDLLWRLGWKNVPLTSVRLKNMSADRLYDTSAIRELVGELPYTQGEAIQETIAWLREKGEI